MKTFVKLSVLPLALLMVGCSVKPQAAWQAVEIAAAVEREEQNGKTDREIVGLRVKEIELKMTRGATEGSLKIPTITRTTTISGVAMESDTVEEVDHAALAILEIGKVAIELAKSAARGSDPPERDYVSQILTARKAGPVHKQPEPESVAVIRELGAAVPAFIREAKGIALGWIAGDTLKGVAANRSNVGDVVTGSNNPSTVDLEIKGDK